MDQNNAPPGQEAFAESGQPLEEQNQEPPTEKPASMEALLEEQGLGLDFPQQGEIRTGVIASIGENEVLVSIGTKSEGIIPARELDQVDSDARDAFTVGQEIPVYVVNPEDPNGVVQLSYVRALEEQDWQLAESLLASGKSYEGNIIGFNKGGLIVPMGQLRGFVPASQVSVLRRLDASGNTPEQRWGAMVHDPITVAVIEVDRERRRLILSERAALQETRESLKERLLDELAEGDVRLGRVTSLAEFGAFVNIDGADGLVHLSEISWERIEHPKEVLRVGQEVKVKVIGIDRERKRIGLSIRQLQEDPWVKKTEHIREGQLVEGTITHLTKFGAFARLGEEMEGLIHISELSEQRVAHPKEVVHEGDVLTLRVIKIEPERHRIGLSLRKVDSPAYADLDWKTTLAEVVEEAHSEETTPTLTEMEMAQEEVGAEAEEMSEAPLEPEVVASTETGEIGEGLSDPEVVVSADTEEIGEAQAEFEDAVSADTEEMGEAQAEFEDAVSADTEEMGEAQAEFEDAVSADTEEMGEAQAEFEDAVSADTEEEGEAPAESEGAESADTEEEGEAPAEPESEI